MAAKLRTDVTMTTSEVGGVLLDEVTGRYWQLNRTGVLILQWLLDGQTAEQTAAALAGRFPVGAARARADVDALYTSLRGAGLISE